jgi:hypothetical protein
MSCGGGADSNETASGYQHVMEVYGLTSNSTFLFYALMVQSLRKERDYRGNSSRGFKAPGWMVTGIIS